jgi:glycosyltransferase involved in cell wall biosynthesis
MINESSPLVSILCITYNHEKYIAQAIEGFLMQKTNFKFEIIIHDDASTDRNVESIKSYQVKHPKLFKCIFQTENQYSKKDGSLEKAIFDAPIGKYVAFCEGDDYWTDPLKLQKQVDFLEANPDHGLVYTKVKQLYHLNNRFSMKSWGGDATTFEQLMLRNQISTLTVVFRNDLFKQYLKDIQPNLKDWQMGDYPIWLYFALKSRIHFINEVTGVYRIIQESASHSANFSKREAFVKSHYDIKKFFLAYAKIKHENLEDLLFASLGTNALMMNNPKVAIKYFGQIKHLTRKNRIMKIICKSKILGLIYKFKNQY